MKGKNTSVDSRAYWKRFQHFPLENSTVQGRHLQNSCENACICSFL